MAAPMTSGAKEAQAERRGVLRGRLTPTFATDKRYRAVAR